MLGLPNLRPGHPTQPNKVDTMPGWPTFSNSLEVRSFFELAGCYYGSFTVMLHRHYHFAESLILGGNSSAHIIISQPSKI